MPYQCVIFYSFHIHYFIRVGVLELESLRDHHALILWMRELKSRRLRIPDASVVGRVRRRSKVS